MVNSNEDPWYVIIRTVNTQCPYLEGEDGCFVLSDSEGELVACGKSQCPLIEPGGGG